jgi:outer membrane protein TolC
MDCFRRRALAVPFLVWAFCGAHGPSARAQPPPAAARTEPEPADRDRGALELPAPFPEGSPALAPRSVLEKEATLSLTPAPGPNAVPLRLGDAIRRSLANVETVQANIAVRTAQVARFDALKEFVPLATLPQLLAGFNQFIPGKNLAIIFPEPTLGTPLFGSTGITPVELSRVFLSFPLDPSGQITALPIAEEGIRAKLLMEQLVRRSQAALAIQRYFQAKQIPYGIRVARRGVTLTRATRALVGRKLLEKQAHDVELTQARVDESRARVLLYDLEKNFRISQRELAVVLHQSRLLVPQAPEPLPIELDGEYAFDLDDPDLVDLALVPDFPRSRDEAIQLAKRQRVEVRILVIGLRIARLRQKRDWLGLLGKGIMPAALSFKNTTPVNGGVALGAIFGAAYAPTVVDIDLWANIRQARLDVIQSQLDLEKALIDVASDTGNSWDRWQQAIQEWEQREKELALRRELFEREERLYQQKQSFPVEVMGTEVNLLQADANRWTAWYNLQLARLDVLRATELLLDYVEKAGIARLPAGQEDPEPGFWKRRLAWLWRSKREKPPAGQEDANEGGQEHESPVVAGVGRDLGAAGGRGEGRGPAGASAAPADGDRVIRTSATARVGHAAAGHGGDAPDPTGVPLRRPQPGRAPAQRPPADPAGRPLPRRTDQAPREPAAPGGGDDRQAGPTG